MPLSSWATFENLPGILYVYDRHGRFLKWNKNFERVSGYSPEEIRRLTALDFIAPAQRDLVASRIAEVLAKGTSSIEAPFVSKDGTATPYLLTGDRLEIDGEACVFGMGIDISERVRIEHQLHEHQALLKMAQRVARVGAWSLDVSSWTPTWSEQIRVIHELPPDEMPSFEGALNDYVSDDRDKIRFAVHACADSGEAFDLEAQLTTRSGRDVWVRVIGEPVCDSDHRVERIQGAVQDITARHAAREQARISEERFRLLAGATNDAIWDWNLVTNETWHGEGFRRLFGQPADDRSSITDWSARIHPDDRDRVTQGIHRALADGAGSWSDEYRYLRYDGSVAHVFDRGSIIRDESGKPTRMVGGISDVTERKKLEAQFLRAQRLESIGTLAGGIAHDLNNILSPILMSAGLLKMGETSAERLRLLDAIETSGRRGSEMVRQVLGFARGVEGKRLQVNVRHLFRDVQKILRETIPKNIDVVFSAPADLWTVTADVTQLHQVLMNLCVNARDAMPNGGALRVEAANVLLDEMYTGMLGVVSPGPYLMITASDTGTGMSQETQERIFEPFFTTKEVGKGTGLGLSTVLTIVKSHGGSIDLQSQPGAGTTFRIYLPAVKDAASDVAASVDPLPIGHGELILVVDDEEHIRTLTQKTLESHGYNVVVARHGAEAVALYAEHRDTAAVLTDLAMPVMDGFAAITALRAIDPGVRVIAASGHSTDDARARMVSAGVAVFIDKPYTVDTLVRAVHDILREGNADGVGPYRR